MKVQSPVHSVRCGAVRVLSCTVLVLTITRADGINGINPKSQSRMFASRHSQKSAGFFVIALSSASMAARTFSRAGFVICNVKSSSVTCPVGTIHRMSLAYVHLPSHAIKEMRDQQKYVSHTYCYTPSKSSPAVRPTARTCSAEMLGHGPSAQPVFVCTFKNLAMSPEVAEAQFGTVVVWPRLLVFALAVLSSACTATSAARSTVAAVSMNIERGLCMVWYDAVHVLWRLYTSTSRVHPVQRSQR